MITLFEISVYIEFVTYYKKRSGGDVVYLEQAYQRPQFLVPTTYAAASVILSYMTSSAISFDQYILSAAEVEVTTWKQRGIGVGVLTFVCLSAALNRKLTLKLSNFLAFVKMVFLVFIIITSFVVLDGSTRVPDPHSIFKDLWKGTTKDGNAISNAILKVSFSYCGTQYLFSLVGETNPPKKKKKYVPVFCPSRYLHHFSCISFGYYGLLQYFRFCRCC